MALLRKIWQILALAAFFVWQLLLSNLRVARDVVRPLRHLRPGIIGIPLDARTDLQITLLSNLITLTPGTLGLDVSDDRKTLYIHSMWVDDIDSLRRDIKTGFERRIIKVLS